MTNLDNYNQALCERLHVEIESRLAKGEAKMNRHDVILYGDGNGNKGTIHRIDTLERAAARNESLFWRILTPALPALYTLLALGVYAAITAAK